MEEAVSKGLTLQSDWEVLGEGSAEDRATFGMLQIDAHGTTLTEGNDTFVNRIRKGPLVSNYHCAEWLAWNYWRLRWEAKSASIGWRMAHRMASIGQGYSWPNITIYSDGERVVLNTRPSSVESGPFRFIVDNISVLRANEFEGAVTNYIEQVISQLHAEGVKSSNLDVLWTEVLAERQDPTTATRRRLEALMGLEPDDGDDNRINALVADSEEAGTDAIQEIAAHSAQSGNLRRLNDLRLSAAEHGFAGRWADAVQLAPGTDLPAIGHFPAWKRGVAAAMALREQTGLGIGPIDNKQIAELAGIVPASLEERRVDIDLSFVLRQNAATTFVFRSKWESGRRFELARLIGDSVAFKKSDKVKLASRSFTYRQKMQRAFAAEFLCPFESLYEELGGDYSDDAIEDAAHLFRVSGKAIRTLLVNNRCIERDQLDEDAEAGIAA